MRDHATVTPLLEWLRRQRRINQLQRELMTECFDVDGALAAGQLELAWWANVRLLAAAGRLYLLERDTVCPQEADWASHFPEAWDWSVHVRAVLEQLAAVDAPRAEQLWQLLLRPLPTTLEDVRRDTTAATSFVTQQLKVPLLNRDTAVRQWADGALLLREVATSLGIAGADTWYLSAEDPGAALGWYDEVIAVLDARSRTG